MRLFRTLRRMVRILFVPGREWSLIAREPETTDLIIKYYAWPFIVLGALVKAGNVFLKFTHDVNLIQFKIPFSLTVLLFYMLVPLFVLLVGGSLISRFSKSRGATGPNGGALRLLIYSYTPVFLATIFINADRYIHNYQYIGLVSVYSVVLFWLGIEPVLHIPSGKRLGLLLFSSLLLSFLFFVMVVVTRVTINLLYPEGVVLFL
ncbi:MAG: YIP1 family protein [Bacteroidota bacterium]|nr:YIP1 family protein [Bacteroidota bacterium]